jgi:hypothetical protein
MHVHGSHHDYSAFACDVTLILSSLNEDWWNIIRAKEDSNGRCLHDDESDDVTMLDFDEIFVHVMYVHTYMSTY